MVVFAVRMCENFDVLGEHCKVAHFDAALCVDIAARVPAYVVADFETMTVIESATLVCDETVTAFFEEFFLRRFV